MKPEKLNPTHLIWLDLEMTGLDPKKDRIIEIATLITDTHLKPVAEGPVLAIHQPNATLEGMDKWNKKHHGRSGLIDRVKASDIDEATAETKTLAFLEQYVPAGQSPLCGSSVHQDRRFLNIFMPTLAEYFHYRHLDVSTMKIIAQRFAPTVAKGFKKKSHHIAMQDIYDSIEELNYYLTHLAIVRQNARDTPQRVSNRENNN